VKARRVAIPKVVKNQAELHEGETREAGSGKAPAPIQECLASYSSGPATGRDPTGLFPRSSNSIRSDIMQMCDPRLS
jgi:hypothetical protein